MKKYDTSNIRNLCVIGSKGVGKTTFLESALFTAKMTGRQGSVDQGNSSLDFYPLELERHQTLSSKLAPIEWNDTKINFLDTPGYADFWGDTVGAIAASDVALIVVESGTGVDVATRRLIKYANNFNRPTCFLINKMNSERADFDNAFNTIKEKNSSAVLFQLPIGKGSEFKGIIDLVDMKAYSFVGEKVTAGDIPEDMKADVSAKRTELIETAAEADEVLLEKYLEGGEISEDELKCAIKKGVASRGLSPVFVAASDNASGTSLILDTIAKHFPSPSEMLLKAKTIDGEEIELKSDANAPLIAQVFKVTSDPGIGEIFFFRVWSGTMKSGSDIFNTTNDSHERIGHLLVVRGKDREEVDVVTAGDIACVAKLKDTVICNTLSDKGNKIIFDDIKFPNPVVPLAMKPVTKKDQDKMGVALQKITAIDPTFKFHIDKEFSETIVTGMGELHIETMVKRLLDRYDVHVELGKPHIPYRETITSKAEKQGKHKKQSGGHGQYGDCWLRISPLPAGGGFEFENKVVGGSIPSKYIPAVEKGVKEALHKGVVAGYPVVDIKVTVYDGSYHDVDSSEAAFKIAGATAFRTAMHDAKPQLQEPIVNLEVYAPQECLGDISSDISSRRGRVSSMDAGVIKAKVPLSELYQYSASLKSITSGAGTYTIYFSHYEQIPAHLAQKVIDATKKEKEEAAK